MSDRKTQIQVGAYQLPLKSYADHIRMLTLTNKTIRTSLKCSVPVHPLLHLKSFDHTTGYYEWGGVWTCRGFSVKETAPMIARKMSSIIWGVFGQYVWMDVRVVECDPSRLGVLYFDTYEFSDSEDYEALHG